MYQNVCVITGVRVGRSSGPVDIQAPLVISDAGVVNTFTKLLPAEVAKQSGELLKQIKFVYYCTVHPLHNTSSLLVKRASVLMVKASFVTGFLHCC
jgi:hypothetical protein